MIKLLISSVCGVKAYELYGTPKKQYREKIDIILDKVQEYLKEHLKQSPEWWNKKIDDGKILKFMSNLVPSISELETWSIMRIEIERDMIPDNEVLITLTLRESFNNL